MIDYLKGRGIFFFSDPAGAKACLALATLLEPGTTNGRNKIISNKAYSFYNEWEKEVEVVDTFSLDNYTEKIDWIFTGTSHPESSGLFEVNQIEAAKAAGIYIFSYIDHWTNMALRFQKEQHFVWPDEVWVVDDYARQKAIEDGIPAEKIVIHGNPYLKYLKEEWRSGYTPETILEKAGLPGYVKAYVLYAPDPISLRNESGKWKFDELSVLQDIADVTADMQDIAIVIKPHPLQPMETLMDTVTGLNGKFKKRFYLTDTDGLSLAGYAAVTVGFHSNFLIEASIFDKPIIRYFPASEEMDCLAHLHLGLKITGKESLKAALKEYLYNE